MNKKYKLILIVLLLSLLLGTTLTAIAGDTENNTTIPVAIDANIFSATSIKLNTEIYKEAEGVVNQAHIDQCFGSSSTQLFDSFKSYIDPLMPITLSLCETGLWVDTRYTWSSAIYSKVLAESGVDISNVEIASVNTDTYLVTGNEKYLGCGTNCTAPDSSHYHVAGLNDNDSLGPLQVLRHYVEAQNYISYSCGQYTLDLMCWKDNLNYFFHNQCEQFSKSSHWNKDYVLRNKYELIALIAVGHNTGSAFQNASSGDASAGSLWNNASAVYAYCEFLSNDTTLTVFNKYIDEWYISAVESAKNNIDFAMPGQCGISKLEELLVEAGINESVYASSFGTKQYYPVKAVLNYLGLERLYTSGVER